MTSSSGLEIMWFPVAKQASNRRRQARDNRTSHSCRHGSSFAAELNLW
jgi:hypothetical protein